MTLSMLTYPFLSKSKQNVKRMESSQWALEALLHHGELPRHHH